MQRRRPRLLPRCCCPPSSSSSPLVSPSLLSGLLRCHQTLIAERVFSGRASVSSYCHPLARPRLRQRIYYSTSLSSACARRCACGTLCLVSNDTGCTPISRAPPHFISPYFQLMISCRDRGCVICRSRSCLRCQHPKPCIISFYLPGLRGIAIEIPSFPCCLALAACHFVLLVSSPIPPFVPSLLVLRSKS